MHLGRVIGNLTATRKYSELKGEKFMIVEPVDHFLQKKGTPVIALDVAQAGEGDIVYFVEGREGTFALDFYNVPVDATIVGIVDDVYKDKIFLGEPSDTV